MSTHDNGRGRKAGPTPEFQSDFATRQGEGGAPQTWGANALNTQKSEVAFMGQGAGRPGQPGQRSIFGGGGPVFVQMPTYTPVTRGPAPQAPEPPQEPSFTPYQASQPAPQTFQNPFASQPVQPAPQPAPAPAPSFPNPQTAALSYQSPDFQPQGYRPNQPQSAPSFAPAAHPGAQAYPAPSYNGAGGHQGYQSQSFQPQSFPDASYGDASFPETGTQDASYSEPKFGEQDFGDATFGDASFEDASFPDANFAAPSSPFGHLESGLDGGFAAQQPHAQPDHGFDPFSEEATHDYVMAQGVGSGQVPPSDPRRQLQAFDALYDQPPHIALGSTNPSHRAPQDFYDSERIDADFLDEGQVAPPAGARSKMAARLKSKSAFMVGSALLGAIALGGALAFVYKQSGGGIGSEPPVVTADNRPVKEVPDQPGGKDFPHKNKLIYDRLTNGDEPETDHLVPRQEDVAVPALPPAQTETAGLPTPVATTDFVPPPATQAIDNTAGTSPLAVATADDTDGGPRRVKTLKVRPDGSVEAPAAQASAANGDTAALPAAAPAPAAAMPVPAAEPPAPAPKHVAAVEPAPAKPKAPKPVATQASATPATGSTKYVVQVGSKKNQTEALASFADMQQKYPALIGSYRPMVQKADLGSKGVWYRLRIGPIADKSAAAKLCSQLKAQGLPDCLVATQ